MQLTLIYLATALPIVFLLTIVYYVDRFREPPRFIIGTFFLGVGLVYPLRFFIIIVEDVIAPLVGIDPGNWGAYQNFFRAAYLEESLKFIFLILNLSFYNCLLKISIQLISNIYLCFVTKTPYLQAPKVLFYYHHYLKSNQIFRNHILPFFQLW